ncbi:MAG: hypothetical protein U0840_09985 [Gemmataceae bacterium]
MPTIRCPGCRRALHLPEHHDLVEVRCPLCQHTFAPLPTSPRLPERIEVPPRPLPVRVPDEEEPDEPRDYRDLIEDDDTRPERALIRAVHGAALWLRWTGYLCLVQVICCGCIDLVDLGRVEWFDNLPVILVMVVLVVRLVVSLVILGAAESLSRRRNRSHVRLGAVLALLVGLYMALRGLLALGRFAGAVFPFMVARINRDDMGIYLIFSVCCAVVALVGLKAGWTTLRLVARPEIKTLFAR